jgi:tetratricopeptide (TPR) repeat protein
LLLGILSSHQLDWPGYQSLNEQAVNMSVLTSDPSLQVVAHVQLAMAFFQFKNPSQALSLYRKITPQVEKCSPLIQSDFYIKQALSLAQAGQVSKTHKCIEKAYDHFPDQPGRDPSSLFTDFGPHSLLSWHATAEFTLARQHLEQFQTVWKTLLRADQLSAQGSAKALVYVQTLRAGTALELNDLERFTHFLTAGITGAKQLKSVRRFQEAVGCYKLAREQWPHEARLLPLADMIIGQVTEEKDTVS